MAWEASSHQNNWCDLCISVTKDRFYLDPLLFIPLVLLEHDKIYASIKYCQPTCNVQTDAGTDPTPTTSSKAKTMSRRSDRRHIQRCCKDKSESTTTALACPTMFAAVTTVSLLLSFTRPSAAFAPFSLVSTSGSTGGFRTRTEATGAGAANGLGKRGALKMVGAAMEQALDSEVDTKSSQAILNNNMKPVVKVPRRDPRKWFDGLRAQAGPRPASLLELSK